MSFWLWILLLAALFWAAILILRQNRIIRDLADSLENRIPFLLSTREGYYGKTSWQRLIRAINQLLEENRRLRGEHAGQVGQLRATLESMQEAVLIVDQSNRIVLANRACKKMFPAFEQPGRTLPQLMPNPAFLEFVEGIRKGDHLPQREIEFGSEDSRIWVELTGSSIPGMSPDDPEEILLVMHNITRLKQLESMRREFVANVSHELRTPLSMIKGYVETLQDEEETLPREKRVKFLDIVSRHTDRLTNLLEDLLSLSQLESRSRPLQKKVIYLEPLIQLLPDTYRDRLDKEQHTLQLRLGEVKMPVYADASKILQVFENLLDNAIKYSPAKSLIEIGIHYEEDTVFAWVKDNGIGISEEDLPRIFERFYRVDKGRSREKGGTGLGLSIVKHIIQLHGGTLHAESQLGKGTTIGFRLPLYRG